MLESTTYKLARSLKKRFGEVEGVTDKDFVTNSYHVPVFEEINAFDKLEKESKFQELSPGGSISYIEVPDMNGNVEAILALIDFMYEHNIYSEINTKLSKCFNCGGTHVEIVKDENGKRIWECQDCGERDIENMHVVVRICGYLGSVDRGVNEGRMGDIEARVLHLK